jgi:uncharacterized protein YndB with AHSA1/START domain
MHGAKIIPFRPLRRVIGEAMSLPEDHEPMLPGHWFVTYWRFWRQNLDRLTAYLTELMEHQMALPSHTIDTPAGEPVVTTTRTFNAPRELVWKVMTDPQHVTRWWGVEGHRNEITAFDFRPGGKWRIISHAPNGEFIFIGEYRDVQPFDRFVTTFGMENLFFGKTMVETHTFEEVAGVTHYTSVSTFDSIEDRDGMVASGMEQGIIHGFAVIDEILAELEKA